MCKLEKVLKAISIVRKRIIDLMGDIPRIELFAREKTEGWDVWGNEVKSDIELLTLERLEAMKIK